MADRLLKKITSGARPQHDSNSSSAVLPSSSNENQAPIDRETNGKKQKGKLSPRRATLDMIGMLAGESALDTSIESLESSSSPRTDQKPRRDTLDMLSSDRDENVIFEEDEEDEEDEEISFNVNSSAIMEDASAPGDSSRDDAASDGENVEILPETDSESKPQSEQRDSADQPPERKVPTEQRDSMGQPSERKGVSEPQRDSMGRPSERRRTPPRESAKSKADISSSDNRDGDNTPEKHAGRIGVGARKGGSIDAPPPSATTPFDKKVHFDFASSSSVQKLRPTMSYAMDHQQGDANGTYSATSSSRTLNQGEAAKAGVQHRASSSSVLRKSSYGSSSQKGRDEKGSARKKRMPVASTPHPDFVPSASSELSSMLTTGDAQVGVVLRIRPEVAAVNSNNSMSPVVAQVESSCLHHTSSNSVTITAPLNFGGSEWRTPGRSSMPGSARSVSAMTPGGGGNGYGAGVLGSAFRYKTPGRTPGKTPRSYTGGRNDESAWKTPLRPKPKTFSYDHVLGADAKQESVFNCVAPLIDCVATGDRNATILASGATGCGKTHTILGTARAPGVLPRAIKRMFHVLHATTKQGKPGQTASFRVSLSYVELYRNRFFDLLASTARGSSRRSVDLHESRSKGIFLSGSETLYSQVNSVEEALRLVRQGNKNRATSATNANEHSSRSHAIVTLHVEVTPTVRAEETPGGASSRKRAKLGLGPRPRVSKLHVIDLAGSERVSQSGAVGVQLQEAQAINLSLTALSNVLMALSSRQSNNRSSPGSSNSRNSGQWLVPYRNSKLTHLLKDSLGGTARTVFIAHVRTIPEQYRQTMLTLDYASRAKTIRNSAPLLLSPERGAYGGSRNSGTAEVLAAQKRLLAERERQIRALEKRQREQAAQLASMQSLESAAAKLQETQREAAEEKMSKLSAAFERAQKAHAKAVSRAAEQEAELVRLRSSHAEMLEKFSADQARTAAVVAEEMNDQSKKHLDAVNEVHATYRARLLKCEREAREARSKADEATRKYEDCEARAEAHAFTITSDLERTSQALEAQRELVAHLREGLAKTNLELERRVKDIDTAKRLADAEAEVALASLQGENRELKTEQLSHRLELLRRGDALGSARLKLSEMEQVCDGIIKALRVRVSSLSEALESSYAAERQQIALREKAEVSLKRAKKKIKDLEDTAKREKKKAAKALSKATKDARALDKESEVSKAALEEKIETLDALLEASKESEEKSLKTIDDLKQEIANLTESQGPTAAELEQLAGANRKLQEKLQKAKLKSARLKEALRDAKEFLLENAPAADSSNRSNVGGLVDDGDVSSPDGEGGKSVASAPPSSRTRSSLRKRKAGPLSSSDEESSPDKHKAPASESAEKGVKPAKKPRRTRTAAAAAASARKKLAAESARKKMEAKARKFKPQIYEDIEEVDEGEDGAEPGSVGRRGSSQGSLGDTNGKKRKLGTPSDVSSKNKGVSQNGSSKSKSGSKKRAKTSKGARGAGSKGKPKGKAFSLFSSLQSDGQLIMPQLKGGDENAQNGRRS